MLDAERALASSRVLTQRELSLAGLAIAEGRAVVVCANKLDVLKPEARGQFLEALGWVYGVSEDRRGRDLGSRF